MELGNQMFSKEMFAGPSRDNGHRVDSDLQIFPLHTQSIFSADVSGDRSITIIDLLSKFFRHLG